MYKFILIILILSLPISCNDGQTNKTEVNIGDFVPKVINYWELQDSIEIYDRQTIFQYIDGAGEVYNSYDFSNVYIFKYVKSNAPDISVEIFDMGKDEDAYGVFSYSRESELSGIGNAYEYIGSVLCFWRSKYYVCVRADDKTEETNDVLMAMAEAIDIEILKANDSTLTETIPIQEIIKYLPEENLKKESIRYLHTYSALNYHYYFGSENVFNLNENSDVVLAEYETSPTIYILLIKYQSVEDMLTAYNIYAGKFKQDIKSNNIIEIGSNKKTMIDLCENHMILILDWSDKEIAKIMLAKTKSKLLKTYDNMRYYYE
ncbi:MAG: DUF6599 family protein [Candidatus Zixiibacteriota bacterium]